MIINEPLTSELIQLRSLDENKISNDYVLWLNDPEIMKHTESRFNAYSLEDIKSYVAASNKSDGALLMGIFSSDTHVGNIKVDFNFHHKTASIGIIIGDQSCHGRGIGSQSIAAACGYVFENFEMYKINAGIYESNIASVRAFEKSGFSVEYTKQKDVINAEGVRENVFMMVRYAN